MPSDQRRDTAKPRRVVVLEMLRRALNQGHDHPGHFSRREST